VNGIMILFNGSIRDRANSSMWDASGWDSLEKYEILATTQLRIRWGGELDHQFPTVKYARFFKSFQRLVTGGL